MRRRRDLAVEGFVDLRSGGSAALADFHRQAAALLAPVAHEWRSVWEQGPLAEAEHVGARLDRVKSGDPGAMARAEVCAHPPAAERSYGCCGMLGTYVDGPD